MSPPNRRTVAVAALVVLLALSGCLQVAVHATVESADVIEEYRLDITTSRTVYDAIEQQAAEEGHDSVEDALLADLDLDEVGAEEVRYDESFDGDDVTMSLTLIGVQVAEVDAITVTERDDGGLVYEDRSFVDDAGTLGGEVNGSVTVPSGFGVDYYLTMPGPIVESNADEVDGNTAEWHATGSEAFTETRIYAESEAPTLAPVPGFGMGVALVAITVVAIGGAFLRRRLE